VWLDLCSGLGGASQPALDRGWRVIRVDIEPRFKPDIVADVRVLPLKPFHVDVLWASFPCQQFSKWGLRCFYPNPDEPDLSCAQGVKDAIDWLRPRWWAVENVLASRPWLTKIFGPVRAVIPGHAIWTNLPLLLPNIAPHKGSFHHSALSGKRWGPMGHATRKREPRDPTDYYKSRGMSRIGTGNNGIEAAEAAVIPYEIGQTICATVERGT
jgi:hypothetical protein